MVVVGYFGECLVLLLQVDGQAHEVGLENVFIFGVLVENLLFSNLHIFF